MVKSRPNRQPKPWDKMTQVRTHATIIRGAQNTRVKPEHNRLETQLAVCKRRIAKHDCYLNNLLREKGRTTDSDRLAVLENKIRKQNGFLVEARIALNDIEEKIIHRNKREQSTHMNLKSEMKTAVEKHKEHVARIVKEQEETAKIRGAKYVPNERQDLYLTEKPLGRMKTYVVKNSKGKKTVKRKWQDNR